MDDLDFFKVCKGVEYLYGESSNVSHFERGKVIGLQQFIQAYTEQFSNDADVFFEHDEILNPQNVFFVLDVFLLRLHQYINLVQG